MKKNLSLYLPLALLAATVPGCKHQVEANYLISDSNYYSRPHLVELFKAEHQVRKAPPLLGVALAGGGTKAAPFSMGVLDGLNEKDMLKDIDVISTVSGGGYTGYWFFSRLTAYEPDLDIQKPITTEHLNTFFEDCLPEFMVSKANSLQGGKIKIKPRCPSPDKEDPPDYTNYLAPTATERGNGDIYRYQEYLRGYQDPFTTSRNLWGRSSFNYATTGQDHSFWHALPDNLFLIIGSAFVNVVPNILFDWG